MDLIMKMQLLFLFLPVMVIFIGCDDPDKTKKVNKDAIEKLQEETSREDSVFRDHTRVAHDSGVHEEQNVSSPINR